MARTVKEYDKRYSEFLDVAHRLFYQKGYDQTSVQDIIREIGVAKGLFYYYFSSKADLLDALIERITAQSLAELEPMIADPAQDAPAKFELFFVRTHRWKLTNKAFLLDLMRVLYSDENALLRVKIFAASVPAVVPALAAIIRQGVAEGVYDAEYPEECAELLLNVGQALASAIAALLLNAPTDGLALKQALLGLERRVEAYERSMERMLGAARGSLRIIDLEQLRAWFA
jgi:AcrR family transcriptional regulator